MSAGQRPAPVASRRLAAFAALLALAACAPLRGPIQPVDGIAWQPDYATTRPHGSWARLGVHELLVQWTVADEVAFVAGTGMPCAPRVPDWERIAAEPWAREVILGLAGSYSESAARAGVERLARLSRRLARLPTPLHVVGWFFPVEVDPGWSGAGRLAALLAPLPRPLWISVYDRANIGPQAFAAALARWLPDDVGILFQDGVGVYAREPLVARAYADALAGRFGRSRVRVIVEAFRPRAGGGFRSATAQELAPQLRAFDGYRLYLFDGPHYVDDALVAALLRPDDPG